MPPVRLVLFDVLYTLIKPWRPIAAEYAAVFSSYLGPIPETAVARSFPQALREMKESKPAYAGGREAWWGEVIRRTAIGAGGDPQDVEKDLPVMRQILMDTFRTSKGYKPYRDVIETLDALKRDGIKMGIVSNSDSRMHDVLRHLRISKYMDVIVLSEEESVEKPSPILWQIACERAGVAISRDVLHVGDELVADFRGAKDAGLDAILLRRGLGVPPISDPWATSMLDFRDVSMMYDLKMVLDYVRKHSV